ncbi:MAG: molybdopterin-dependent oxidoreductase [Firmicutes bacterium]|nr:molybdopterin-dependent oxidoreductase [Bacillota bacterium]
MKEEKYSLENVGEAITQFRTTRRQFIKTSALLGGSALAAGQIHWALGQSEPAVAGAGDPYELVQPKNILYSACLQCNTGCPIKVKIQDGRAVKIDGNPLAPWTMVPHLPYKTALADLATIDGAICPKGQAGVQTAYDPYRIRKVLKRAGKRGENKWVAIPFEQAIKEVVEGGKLFAGVAGEETRHVEGLKDIYALRDPKVAKDMADDVKNIWSKKMTVAEFKEKYKDHLASLIDPDHPDLGPKNNQFIFMFGRLKGGRSELIKRVVNGGLGSTNIHGHTTVCQGSLYFTSKAMTEQFIEGKWTGGQKFYWQADTGFSEFLLFVGASPFEANYGPPLRAGRVSDGLARGDLKIAVVDPRFSKTASKAWKWVPIKPGTEAAMAMAMIRWIIDNKRFDARYLANANKAAAKADREPTWCNASWLVKIVDGKPGPFLHASEIDLTKKEKRKTADGKGEYEFDPFVVLKGGKPVAFDSYDDKNAVEGDLLVDTEIKGVKVKSALQVLYETAAAKTIDEWCTISGINPQDLAELANEFTSHGKRAAADLHRGVSQHTNGFYNVFAWMSVNLLIGNLDWKGGMIKASTYNYMGGKEGQPFNLDKMHPNKMTPFGIDLLRHNVKYEDTTLFAGYPAKRHWFTLSSDVYQEIIPSAGDAYPYQGKILFIYMGSPVYSAPGGHAYIEILSDLKKIPLIIANDIVVGETSMYADYIFPDISYLERWEFHGSHPSVAQKVQPLRQPVISPLTETVKVFGEEMPICLEAFLLAIAEKLALPGFGKDGFGPGLDLKRPEDYYLKMVANLGAGEKPGNEVPDASDDEVKLFLEARRHLPPTVFDPARWEKAAGALWRKAICVMNRGGRFDEFEKGYDGDQMKNKYGTFVNLYQEKTYKTKNSMTGKAFSGVAYYSPPYADSLGRPIEDERAGYDLKLITFKEILQTKSRTVADYWLLSILPENTILLNSKDAARLGLQPGDMARIVSASNPEGVWKISKDLVKPITGKVKVVEGLRPGVAAFALGFGHWAVGAGDLTIDGQKILGDPRRARGLHGNAAMRLDPHLKNVGLSDLTGGSAVFYDSLVKVVKA